MTRYSRSEEGKAAHRAAMARHRRTEKGKATKARYNRTEKGRATGRATVANYRRTEKGKATKARYSRTEKGRATSRAAQTRYSRTEKGMAAQAARRHTNRAIASGRMQRDPCLVCGLTPFNPATGRARVEFHHAYGYAKVDWGRGVWLCRDPRHGHTRADRDPTYNADIIKLVEI